MSHTEHALVFDCEGEPCIGVVSVPEEAQPRAGLLIVVGGPQYRVGSHRLFVHLARQAAEHGLAAMRFDYRGMGDSWAALRDFEAVGDDLRHAIDAFMAQVPSLRSVVIWGLCDGASAACFYAPTDPRVSGLVLINPWVHTPEGAASTRLRHYYLQRLLSRVFWAKLLTGRVIWRDSLKTLGRTLSEFANNRFERAMASARAAKGSAPPAATRLPARMAEALSRSGLPVAIALSDDDKVAREFESQALPSPAWRTLLSRQLHELAHLRGADHTVTAREPRDRLCDLSVRWARDLGRRG